MVRNPVIDAVRRALTLAPMTIVLFILVPQGRQLACAQTEMEEYKVKAAFLFHFAQFVEWPTDAFNSGGQSLNVCIFDNEPHLQDLQSALVGKAIGTRVVHVQLLHQRQPLQGCSILFLGRDEGRHQTATLRNLQGEPILTVGESNNFLSEGGIIRLRLVQNKVRFDINVGVADSSHLKISSRLLLLASSVTLGDRAKGGQ